MDSVLCMNVGFVNTTFQALDRSDYEDLSSEDIASGHMAIQQLIKLNDLEDNESKKCVFNVCTNKDMLKNPFTYSNCEDGLYKYSKLLIPSSNHPDIEEHKASESGYLYYDVHTLTIYHYESGEEVES